MSNIQAVVFDLGKVLLDFDYKIAALGMARKSTISPQQVQAFIDHSPLLCRYEKGQISREAFFEEVRQLTSYTGTLEEFSALFSDVFTPIEPMIDLQQRLAGAGLRTFIFSNTNDLAIDHIRATYPFYNRFDGYVLSYERGFMKPEPQIYSMMEDLCGNKGSAICYIDDRQENVEAGRQRGWSALVHTEPSVTISWVENLCLVPNGSCSTSSAGADSPGTI